MSSESTCRASEGATLRESLSTNRDALFKAAAQVESLAAVLKNLEASTRGVALRESTQAHQDEVHEPNREELSQLQLEANKNFAELRRNLSEMQQNLNVLYALNDHILAASSGTNEFIP